MMPTNDVPGVKPDTGTPETLQTDSGLRLRFGKERLVMPLGLQPSLLVTHTGTLVLQAQTPEHSRPSHRISYPYSLKTLRSADGGDTWKLPADSAGIGLNMEGGAISRRDGSLLFLDTYILPGEKPGEGIGQIYQSGDDARTLTGPSDVRLHLPGVKFDGSTDDGGRPHRAIRAHRRILEMPDGSLMATVYGWMTGDNTPCSYQPKMKKMRILFVRSADKGRNWELVSNVSVAPEVGTEGLDEPVLCRISTGPEAGKLICWMRTGRELYEAISRDDGRTWTPPAPRIIGGIDINRSELWKDSLRETLQRKGVKYPTNPEDLKGAVVDPDLIELRSGLLVGAFGVRIPHRLCWHSPEHPWNGNYLAFSRDQGKTWSTVVRVTSGVLTTHYMAIEETPVDNRLFVTYDLGGWSQGMYRAVHSRTLDIKG